MKIKNIVFFVLGLIISYGIYYFVARNGNIVMKLLFGGVAAFSWWSLISPLLDKIKDASFYESVYKLALVLCFPLAVLTYEQFEKHTYGSIEEQRELLDTQSEIAVAHVTNITHTPAMVI